ncbi:MAG: SDR family oxidoreductase [Trueperaceae bacterium]|nr:SDR family oxidoreductase [Trueperaceae bacterium]
MNLGLKDKRAVVLAASGGLGFACAEALAQEGATVALCSREAERAEKAAQKISQSTGQSAFGFAADVSQDASLKSFFDAATTKLGGLDILICNAGGPPPGGFSALDESKWDFAYQLTLQSVVRSVRYALPQLRQSSGGSILVIGSSSMKQPIPNLLLSNVFRPAIQGLCKSLSAELAEDKIRVNCLAPGRVETERINQLDQASAEKQGLSIEEIKKRSLASIPMGRLGQPEEFGKVAAFLCSDGASYMTGSTLYVDGGSVRAL